MGILEEKLQMTNWIESGNKRRSFEKEWLKYIFSFEDVEIEKYEYSSSDRDLEAWTYGCDISAPFLSDGDKIKVKRYRKEDCKR